MVRSVAPEFLHLSGKAVAVCMGCRHPPLALRGSVNRETWGRHPACQVWHVGNRRLEAYATRRTPEKSNCMKQLALRGSLKQRSASRPVQSEFLNLSGMALAAGIWGCDSVKRRSWTRQSSGGTAFLPKFGDIGYVEVVEMLPAASASRLNESRNVG
ncbi:hypothetical protein SAMN06265222_107236 [Neorhodopirellula lusitana]|uniref:Uncharacterized protein n=1 Tax=Neorhodopirellula lusitana TaxID=445327 RepID=A0ABY1Q9G1_9BACT|nr:hypothetical protein SAMN06265222_107236 [Neorhodopirellula lusitana]